MTTNGNGLTPFLDAEDYIYGPDRQAGELIAWARRVKAPDYRLVDFGVPTLDEAVTLFPGSLTAIAGRPGMGKSQLCKHLARREVERIRRAESNDLVVFVTLEEHPSMIAGTVNDVGYSSRDIHRGNFDLAAFERSVHNRVPERGLFLVAHPGIVGTGKERRLADPLSSRRVLDSIARLEATLATGARPTLVILDYLQLLRPDADRLHREQTKVAEVMAAVEGAKEIASACGAAVVMAVQASREADNRRPPLPEPQDMQWASAIEQACDVVLGVLRPIRHPLWDVDPLTGDRPDFAFKGRNLPVDDALMMIGIAKQRHGEGYGHFAVSMDPARSHLEEHPWTRVQIGGGR